MDLIIDLLDSEWNHKTQPPPHYAMIPPIHLCSQPTIYPTSELLNVDAPYCPQGLADGYIDDIWIVVVSNDAYTLRENASIDVAIHLIFKPLSSNKLIPRNGPLSLVKPLAEGQMEAIKLILGWELDKIHHKMKLSQDKVQKWKHGCTILSQQTQQYYMISNI